MTEEPATALETLDGQIERITCTSEKILREFSLRPLRLAGEFFVN
jgi:hypothetical protein